MRLPSLIVILLTWLLLSGTSYYQGGPPNNLGWINVKDPIYGAKGDCTTDDTAAIQSAITAACTSAPNSAEAVYLPPTPGSCYYTTAPIQMNCAGLNVFGAGPTQSLISKGFDGPTFIIQSTTGWSPPFLSSITATWQSNHAYAQFAEILDSNGNIEVATTGGTSAPVTQPVWGVVIGHTVVDNGVTWTLESIGTQLLTGSGSAYDGLQYNGAFSQQGIPIDWSEASWASSLNGATAFTIEATVVMMSNAGGSDSIIAESERVPPFPGAYNLANPYNHGGAFQLAISQSTAKPIFVLMINGVQQFVQAPTNLTLAAKHHIAGTYDGTTMTLWVDGVSVATGSHSGSLTQTNGEQVCGPCQNLSTFAIGALDGLRMSRSVRYTSAFTPPTAKFASDGNTQMLFNFVASAVPGTQQGQDDGFSTTGNVFLPQEAGSIFGQVGGVFLHDIGVRKMTQTGAGPMVWAAWAYNTHYSNLADSGSGGGTDSVINLYDNDYQSRLDHLMLWSAGPKFGSEFSMALNIGTQSTAAAVTDVQVDGGPTVALLTTSAGDATNFKVTDRGSLVWPFVLQGGFTLIDAFVDSEGTGANLTCDIYSYNSWAPNTIIGGELDMDTSVSPSGFMCVSGGKGDTVTGGAYDVIGGAVSSVLDVISAPPVPVVFRDAKLPAIARTNSSKGQYLSIQQNGAPEQSTNANLWACSAIDLGSSVLVTDNDSACTFGGTPAHSSCVIGTNCFACLAKCSVSGATTYAWVE